MVKKLKRPSAGQPNRPIPNNCNPLENGTALKKKPSFRFKERPAFLKVEKVPDFQLK